MSHPYLPLYVDDYEAATAHLTAAEDGVYSRLLRLCWRTPGCSLPNDHGWIARKIRVSAKDYDTVARPVIEEFFKLSRGRLVQKRLKAEYDDISRKKSARVKAGKKGGDAKALKSNDIDASNATVLPAHAGAFPEPYPEPDTDRGQASVCDASAQSDFEKWWKAYPNATAKPKAEAAYDAAVRVIGAADAVAILAEGLERSKASPRWQDPTYTKPNPVTWLSEARWLDRHDQPDAKPGREPPAGFSPEQLAARVALLETLN